MSTYLKSLLRHLLPVVAPYLTSSELPMQISVPIAAAIAYAFSVLDKKVNGRN